MLASAVLSEENRRLVVCNIVVLFEGLLTGLRGKPDRDIYG